MPYAFSYKSSSSATPVFYYYVTNLQGDVVKILTASGAVVANYSYNAWGKLLSSSGTMASVNPIRYRGYYFDAETGFYYLVSRYYDPQICRFVNVDSFASTGQGLLGTNTFAYGLDNPVMLKDSAGQYVTGTGVVGEANFGGGRSVGLFMINDDKGNEATILTGTIGGGTPNASASIVFFTSDADDIFQYVGSDSLSYGGTAWWFGLSKSHGTDLDGNSVSTTSFSVGLSFLPGLSVGLGAARFVGISKYHNKLVPKDVTMDFFEELPSTKRQLIQNQLHIPEGKKTLASQRKTIVKPSTRFFINLTE